MWQLPDDENIDLSAVEETIAAFEAVDKLPWWDVPGRVVGILDLCRRHPLFMAFFLGCVGLFLYHVYVYILFPISDPWFGR